MSQLMRLWYLTHRRPAKARASLRIRAILPEHSLFAHINYGSRRWVRPKIRSSPLDDCACVFEEWIYRGHNVPKSHELAPIMTLTENGRLAWALSESRPPVNKDRFSISLRSRWSSQTDWTVPKNYEFALSIVKFKAYAICKPISSGNNNGHIIL